MQILTAHQFSQTVSEFALLYALTLARYNLITSSMVKSVEPYYMTSTTVIPSRAASCRRLAMYAMDSG